MKFYKLDTELRFGKYEGISVRSIIKVNPQYFEWCIMNLDHFYLSKEVVTEIENINPLFKFSDESMQKLSEKYEEWINEINEGDFDNYSIYYRRTSYDNYNGSYAQDIEGWSDQDIDDVFDGDPDAYWNID